MLAFPYQNYIPIVANRHMVAPFLQSYIVSSERLQRHYIAALEQDQGDIDVLFGIDHVASRAVDGVQSIARTPLLFEYLYGSYRLASPGSSESGLLLLEPDTRTGELAGIILSYAIDRDGRELTIQLPRPAQCSLAGLTLRISYPVWSVLGHSAPIHLRFFSESKVVAETNLVALSGSEPFRTYVSLLPPADFHWVFGSSDAPTVQWDRLVISPVDQGMFGVEPTSVDINSVDCISVSGLD